MSSREVLAALLGEARPRVVAALLRSFRDLDLAEDGFQEASARAASAWPEAGLPRDPVAWLIRTGRNAVIDALRRDRRRDEVLSTAATDDDVEMAVASALDEAAYGDDVLRLLFVCCPDGLAPAHQVALALRVVCGLSVGQVARAFLVSESAMEQRLTRAKARIAEMGVPFEVPPPAERARRLRVVAAMVYLVFNEGYSANDDPTGRRITFCEEGIRLARLLRSLAPAEPELTGLLALLLLQHARSAARHDATGQLVALDAQDRTRWDRGVIAEGLDLLMTVSRDVDAGSYVLQAAIAAEHAIALTPEDTHWAAIDGYYAALERLQPTPVVSLNRAVAIARSQGPAAGLAHLEPLEPRLRGYMYWHGVRARLLTELGRLDEARDAFESAIALAPSNAEVVHLRAELAKIDRTE